MKYFNGLLGKENILKDDSGGIKVSFFFFRNVG